MLECAVSAFPPGGRTPKLDKPDPEELGSEIKLPFSSVSSG